MPPLASRAPKAKSSSWSCNTQCATASGLLLLLLVLLVQHQSATPAAATASDTGSSAPALLPTQLQLMQLQGQREEMEGTEVVWQAAPAGSQPKGLLLAFHGCSHGAIDWWPKSESCPTCIGLPEEVLITRTALARSYAVVAVSSRDRAHRRCWAVPHLPGTHSVDTLSVATVVAELQQRHQSLRGLPLYAVGASSGGAFALTLTAYLPLSAVCSQIMAVPGTWYKAFLDARDSSDSSNNSGQQQQQQQQHQQQQQEPKQKVWPEPPVLFVHMTRDEHTAARVKESVEIRRAKGLATHVLDVMPQPLTAELLARAPELAGEAGQQLLQLFQQQGVIDAAGLLVEDPRQANWHAVVQGSGIPGLKDLNLTPDESGLSELLNMAYAQHEIIADTTSQMLDWFEQQPVAGAPDHH